MLAFLVDQVQALCDLSFQKARQRRRLQSALWEFMRTFFSFFEWDNWESYYGMIAYRAQENSS
jgi:hypothetical protein